MSVDHVLKNVVAARGLYSTTWETTVLSEKDLEELSDKVRRGEPIGFSEAIAVIDFQERMMVDKKHQGFLRKLFRRIADNTGEGQS